MDRSFDKVVISFVSRQSKIIEVRLGVRSVPIMIPKGREKFVGGCPVPITSLIGENEFVIVLADVPVDRASGAIRIVIVPNREDEIRIPAFDQGCHVCFKLSTIKLPLTIQERMVSLGYSVVDTRTFSLRQTTTKLSRQIPKIQRIFARKWKMELLDRKSVV